MSKTASNIVARALTLMDEVVTTFTIAATTETSLREMGLEILPEVCRDLIKELPWDLKRYLATEGTLTAVTLSNGEDQSDYYKQKLCFTAPDDFWELVSLRLTAWAKPVTDYILINGEGYAKQNNPHTRAGKQNPVIAMNCTASGGNARIECFSVNDGDSTTVANFQYVSFDNVPDDDSTTWPNELFDTVTKALALQLSIIKGRQENIQINTEEIKEKLDQHS